MVTDEAKLAVAEQLVREAERIVAQQRQVIGLRSQGHETTEAEQMLALYEEALKVFRRHRDRILKELGREA